jgi:16S rRNA C967 or C1407 C5-methylase (RsmB/RsmF family)
MTELAKSAFKLAERLFPDEGDRCAFLQALTEPPTFGPTILWTRPKPPELDWETFLPLPWQPAFVDRLVPPARPGSHPLHDAGYFYCLDFSSVFAASPLQMIASPLKVVLDLCAAPGGKSLFAWLSLHPPSLICNEVIRKRVRILIANLKRCGAMAAIVLSEDSAHLAENLPHAIDLVLVDAPCSGQSLLAKGESVPGCFHQVTLNRNANRQKRILANAAALLKPGGHLLYSTCTYAPQENEQVCTWFLKKFPAFTPVTVPPLQAYQSSLTDLPCYRLFPHSGLGAGAFTMLLQRREGDLAQPLNTAFLEARQFRLYTSSSDTSAGKAIS